MKKAVNVLSPKEALNARMNAAYKLLQEIANKKTENKNVNAVYSYIGLRLGVTGQTVGNYVSCVNKKGNGFLIESLIDEFNNLNIEQF